MALGQCPGIAYNFGFMRHRLINLATPVPRVTCAMAMSVVSVLLVLLATRAGAQAPLSIPPLLQGPVYTLNMQELIWDRSTDTSFFRLVSDS